VVIFYGGTFIGVVLVDYGLVPYHWIHKHAATIRSEAADHTDGDEMEEALIKRPSLMKVP